MSEIRLTNQELTEKVRDLTNKNRQLESEPHLKHVNEMDNQISELIKQTSAYKGNYLKAMETSQRLEADIKAKESTLTNLQSGYQGMETILKTTQQMLELTKEQYSEQLETNTSMRACLTELYNMVVAPEATRLDNQGRIVAMSTETQMQLV